MSQVSPNKSTVDESKIEQDAQAETIARAKTDADAGMKAAETRAEMVITRTELMEKYTEMFGNEQAQTYMEMSDAIARWYELTTGNSADEFYSRYYADVRKSAEADVIGDLEQAYNRIEPSNRQMTQADAQNFARMLSRKSEGDVRAAIREEGNKADRIAILNELYNLDPEKAQNVARAERDMLFQTGEQKLDKIVNMKPVEVNTGGLGQLPFKEMKAQLLEIYQRFSSVVTSDGRKVQFPRSGFDKTIGHSGNRLDALVLADLPNLLTSGTEILVEKSRKGNNDTYHHYVVKTTLDGVDVYARILVREELKTRNFYYDSHTTLASEINKTLSDGRPSSATEEASKQGSKDRLLQWIAEVKGQDGKPLYQSEGMGAKGAVVFDADGIKATIHAFEAADFSTLIHENAHVFRRMLKDVAERTRDKQVIRDLATIEEWAGVKDGVWTRENEEHFARGFENYIATGEAPTPKLRKAFESFSRWMLSIYKTITGSAIDVEITPAVKDVFDRMLGGEGERMKDEGGRMNEGAEYERNLAEVKETQYGKRYGIGDIVRMKDGSQTTVKEVRADASMLLDNGRVVSPFEVERVAGQENMFGDLGMKDRPDAVQSTLFQEADPVDTPAFKRWFGDSKVVDENGRPLVVYHNTHSEIDTFLPAAAGVDNLQRSASVADEYRNKIQNNERFGYASFRQGSFFTPNKDEYLGYGPKQYAVYIRAENPVYVDMRRKEQPFGPDPNKTSDALIFMLDGKIQEIAVLLPEQVKSVNNRGTFDPKDPRILFQSADQPMGTVDATVGDLNIPHASIMDEGYKTHLRPLLEKMREVALEQVKNKPLDGVRDMSPEGQAMMRKYMQQVCYYDPFLRLVSLTISRIYFFERQLLRSPVKQK